MINITIPWQSEHAIVALGADLKCRPAAAVSGTATIFDEIGDLAFPENQEALEKFLDRQAPKLLLCDRHPGYFSTELARRFAIERSVPVRDVQHHRAHVASVCVEHGLYEETVVGLAFDGTGYGDDGTAWGGEFLVGSVKAGFERKAHFAPLPIPGGDVAVRQPWRIALALLIERESDPLIIEDWIERRHVPVRDLPLFRKALESGVAVGRSSALGRWFDAVSALLGVRVVADFEAQPAIELQKLAEKNISESPKHDWPLEVQPGDPIIIDFPDILRIATQEEKNIPRLAVAFHFAVAEAVAQVARHLAEAAGTNTVIASGGCFLNALLGRLLSGRLSEMGLTYVTPKNLPPGDQAISLGQIGLVLSSLQV